MFSCSQQSIFSAMDRFVKAVNNMDATVLVPSKLRDMEISSNGGNGSSHSSKVRLRRIPPALANTPDLYSFYIMLNEVKKELLWGPGTGAVAAATMGSSVGGLTMGSSVGGLMAAASSAGLSGRSSPGRDSTATNTSSNHSSSNHSCLLHSSASIASSLITSSSSGCPSSSSGCPSSSSGCPSSIGHGGQTSTTAKQHSRQPSDDSLGSIGSSTVSSSEHDTDSEVDSLLTDRDSVGDEHTSHLAAAFRHHLQGLHTILHQLADSADYLSSRYQEEIDASSL